MVRSLAFVCALSMVVAICSISYAGDKDSQISPSQVQQGQAITPVRLNLTGKSPAQVYLGSYIVNSTGDCSGCHSFPQYLEPGAPGKNPTAGDPFEGTPSTQSVTGQLLANFNSSHYLAGGQCFGPFMARNLTPEPNDQPYPGLPEGLTEAEFIKVMRTGEDIHCEKEPNDPICTTPGPDTPTLQVMPWATYHSMTDSDLKAIYAYLTAIPTANACNTVTNGCPGLFGAAQSTPNSYAYRNTPDCPNPAPPQ